MLRDDPYWYEDDGGYLASDEPVDETVEAERARRRQVEADATGGLRADAEWLLGESFGDESIDDDFGCESCPRCEPDWLIGITVQNGQLLVGFTAAGDDGRTYTFAASTVEAMAPGEALYANLGSRLVIDSATVAAARTMVAAARLGAADARRSA